jgi:hypothetical protein
MELARLERQLNKPINWGERIYHNLKKREVVLQSKSSNSLVNEGCSESNGICSSIQLQSALSDSVREALEQHPTVSGPLDASSLLSRLSVDDLSAFFACYTQLKSLVLTNWHSISLNLLRCISITFGESLLELDLSSSSINESHMEVLFVRTSSLKVLRLNCCPSIDVRCFMILTPLLYRSVEELYLSQCTSLSNECLLWIGGKGSLSGFSFHRLTSLDLSYCTSTIGDSGIVGLAYGCHNLQFLNLDNLSQLTDKSLPVLFSSNKKITVLNLCNCYQITNKTVITIGKNLSHLVSLNLSRCQLVTDKGIKSVALGCKKIQAVNLSGLLRISEESMFCLVDSCKGLLTMNVTGCDRITTNGLENLIMGLQFVEKAISFVGFKPVDSYLEILLENRLKMIVSRDAIEYEQQMKRRAEEEKERNAAEEKRIFLAAKLIQEYMFRYKKRMFYYRLWQLRIRKQAILTLQRVYRGYVGRKRAIVAKEEFGAFLAMTPYALLLQCHIRGFLSRARYEKVSKCIRELYIIRKREVQSALAVRFQSHARRYLAKKYVISYRELQIRYKQNINDAILILQMLARRFLSKMELHRRKVKKRNLEEARRTAGFKIKKFSVEGMRRYKGRLSGESLKKFFRHKWTASTSIQAFYRGFKGREYYNKLKIEKATRFYAAREIQRAFRGSRVLYYKDLRLNVIAAFILDRHYVERRERVVASRLRYRQYILINQQDSASEPDTEEDEQVPWIKQFDGKKKLPYWQNFSTNEITYDEPLVPLAHEKSMIGKRVKVFWVVQSAWYEGTITRYHLRKKRHRVEYDDGDHEWISLENEGERVMVYSQEGGWILYLMYHSEAKQDELRKIEEKQQRDEYKSKAFRDATQWKAFSDDYNSQIMFLSTLTGEIRTGLTNALDWIVQDDGYGFPAFYNNITHQVVYEDPRFKNDVDEDLLQQRKYVLQEMRYLLYLCKNLWEEYVKLHELNDTKQLYRIMMKIRSAPPVHQLSAFIIRAKALYEPTSIVDKPLDKVLVDEFEYASWIVARLSEVIDKIELMLIERRDKKKVIIEKLTEKNDEVVYCRFCKRETQKHLAFCPTCGKPQLFY